MVGSRILRVSRRVTDESQVNGKTVRRVSRQVHSSHRRSGEVYTRGHARAASGALELVYDNYNALVIEASPDRTGRRAIFSIVLYPRWVRCSFSTARGLPDPHGLLKGKGKVVRHIVLDNACRSGQASGPACPWTRRRAERTPLNGEEQLGW